MTRVPLHISTQVLPGDKNEIETPELAVGQIVEVFMISSMPLKKNESDPLIGLFKRLPDLATQSEEILHQETQGKIRLNMEIKIAISDTDFAVTLLNKSDAKHRAVEINFFFLNS